MNNQSIHISTNLTEEDLKRIGFRQIRTKLILIGSVAFIFTVILALGIATILLTNKNNIRLISILPLLIPIGIVLLPLITLIWAVSKQAKQLGKNIEETKYIFDEQGMEAESASVSVKTLWSNFLKVKENDTDFLLFTQKNIAIPIPKRFFVSENQITEFRNLLSEKLGKQAKLKN